MSRATVLFSWSVPDVVRLDDLDTWSCPAGYDWMIWIPGHFLREMIGWCVFLTRVPAGRVRWFGSLPSRRPVFDSFQRCVMRGCVRVYRPLKDKIWKLKRGIGLKWTQMHSREWFKKKRKKKYFKMVMSRTQTVACILDTRRPSTKLS